MVYYIQRKRNSNGMIASGAILQFETPLATSQTSGVTPSDDFVYQENGSIDILRAVTYTVFWYVTNMANQSTVGQSYQLKKTDFLLATPIGLQLLEQIII